MAVCGCVFVITSTLEMGSSMDAAELEEIVLTWVSQQKHDTLEQLYQVLSITCPPENKGKRMKLLNGLLAYLVTLDDSQSEAAVLLVHKFMGEDATFKKDLPALEMKTDVIESSQPAEMNNSNRNSAPSPAKHRPVSDMTQTQVADLVRFKEVKIGGVILGKGENRISYASLQHVVQNAQKLRYSPPLISAAIIKAISPTHKVKALLEAKRNMSVEDIMELLRNHYKKDDRATVLTDLRTSVQPAGLDALEFVTELMWLRERVIELSNLENYPVDEENLWEDVYEAMNSGLRNANIRIEVREMLNRPRQTAMNDNLLSKIVSDAENNEKKREKKFMDAKAAAAAAAAVAASANVVDSHKPPHPKRDNPFDKIEELRMKQESDMSSLRADFAEVKTAVLRNNAGNSQQSQMHYNNHGGNANSWQSGGGFGNVSGNLQQNFGLSNSQNGFSLNNYGTRGALQQPGLSQFQQPMQQQSNVGQMPSYQFMSGGMGQAGGMPFQHQGYRNQQGGGNGNSSGQGRRGRNKCPACLQGNVRFCVHCLSCGGGGHRANACPLKNNGNAGSNPVGANAAGGSANGTGIGAGAMNSGANQNASASMNASTGGGNSNSGTNSNAGANMISGINSGLPSMNIVDGIIFDHYGNPIGIDQGNG